MQGGWRDCRCQALRFSVSAADRGVDGIDRTVLDPQTYPIRWWVMNCSLSTARVWAKFWSEVFGGLLRLRQKPQEGLDKDKKLISMTCILLSSDGRAPEGNHPWRVWLP